MLKEMDKDDSGTIDIKEFTTWLVQNYTRLGSEMPRLVGIMRTKMILQQNQKGDPKVHLG